MTETHAPALSVAALFAGREDRRRREREAEAQLQRKSQEALDEFQVTDERVRAVAHRIREAFDRGETELMLTSFPSSFCTDDGRAVNNADVPPINRLAEPLDASLSREPEWLGTLPRGIRAVYEHWKRHLQPGGFQFSARIINYPGGKPGDVGLFLSWPKSAVEQPT